MLSRRRYKLEEQEQLIPLINEIRRDHPRMSARDIYIKLQPSCMGRDQFERFCMDSGYRIKRLKNYRVTTNSLGVTRFPNLIKDLRVTRVNQVFVSDITYFDIGPDTYYLTFIMDLFNREIVGWSASDNLRTESTTLPALHRLITERGRANLKGAILHSDGVGERLRKMQSARSGNQSSASATWYGNNNRPCNRLFTDFRLWCDDNTRPRHRR